MKRLQEKVILEQFLLKNRRNTNHKLAPLKNQISKKTSFILLQFQNHYEGSNVSHFKTNKMTHHGKCQTEPEGD